MAQARAGSWVRVRPGAYIDRPEDDLDRHAVAARLALARLVAIRAQLSSDHVLSHSSAALLWGLPLLRAPTRAHAIVTSCPTGRSRDVVRHVMQLADEHVTRLMGFRVTTLERTVVDCAMAAGGHTGLLVADAALAAGASRDACRDLVATMPGRRGVITARAVIDLADDGAESPGESSARFVLLRAGLPRPETQVRTDTHLGPFWSDLGWPEWALLAEYDGRAKYEASGSASAAVLDEKRRQDAIEESGRRVLRIVADDLRAPDSLLRRVLRAAPRETARTLEPRPALTTRPVSSSF